MQASRQSNLVTVFIISDSVGETAQKVSHATLAQFPDLDQVEVKRFPFVTNEEDLLPILEDAYKVDAVLVTTLVLDNLNHMVKAFVQDHHMDHIDYLSDFMQVLTRRTGLHPVRKSGNIHAMNQSYFDRVEAIEFAVKFDDGRNPKGFKESDIVLLGVSRTSKTPLSIYLANQSYKVSNLPLIPEITLPKEIYQVPQDKLIGLIASPHYIMRIRQERMKMLGLNQTSQYDDLQRIKAELEYAQEVYDKLGAYVINIENRSIEETVVYIQDFLKSQEA